MCGKKLIEKDLKCKGMLNGLMVYWNAENEAISYTVTLYIDGQPVSVRMNPRTELYCSFEGLASGIEYSIKVQAEDHYGNIIAESDVVNYNVNGLEEKLDDMLYKIGRIGQSPRC